MSSHSKFCLIVMLACVAIASACDATAVPDIPIERFSVDSVEWPSEWKEEYHGKVAQVEAGVSESWRQVWKPVNNIWTGFSFDVDKYRSNASARDGYQRSLRRFREYGFTMEPLPEWKYVSAVADQYTMYCGWPETTGEFCYSVARYGSFVVVIGLTPGAGVTLDQAPKLFGMVDQHIGTVIEAARRK